MSLRNEVECPVLDEMYPYLYIFTTKSSSHIGPLQDHVGKGRKITVTERPGLHLVRFYATIYVKPIPLCLLNFAFWKGISDHCKRLYNQDPRLLNRPGCPLSAMLI